MSFAICVTSIRYVVLGWSSEFGATITRRESDGSMRTPNRTSGVKTMAVARLDSSIAREKVTAT